LNPQLEIVNVVSTCDIKQKVDIASFNTYKHLHSDLSLYSAGYIKDSSMTGRVTVYASGKMISVGTKSTRQSFGELDKAVQIMKKYKLIRPVRIAPKTRNIVAMLSLNINLDIEKLARCIPKTIYEPEVFPALILRIPTVAVYLVFNSGKIIINGIDSEEKLNNAVFEIRELLKQHDTESR